MKFDYIIVTEENTWESTGKNATQKEIDQDVADVRDRLGLNDAGDPVELTVFKAPKMEQETH